MVIDPNWVGATGQWFAGLVTVGIIWIAITQNKEAKKQAQEAKQQNIQTRYDAAKPLISVDAADDATSLPGLPVRITTHGPDHPAWVNWDQDQCIKLRNIGTGSAFNIVCVMYAPEAVIVDNAPSSLTKEKCCTSWFFSTIAPKDKIECVYLWEGNGTFHEKYRYLDGYSFNAPAQKFENPNKLEQTCLCRVSVTYHDIFKRKHASIFDCVLIGHEQKWEMVTYLENIPHDLRDIQEMSLRDIMGRK